VLGIAGLTIAMSMPPASAAEKLRTSKAAPEAFSFTPLDIGMRKGLFAKHGIEVESIAFAGDARMQQMMATDFARYRARFRTPPWRASSRCANQGDRRDGVALPRATT
jgi:hypothetical protein